MADVNGVFPCSAPIKLYCFLFFVSEEEETDTVGLRRHSLFYEFLKIKTAVALLPLVKFMTRLFAFFFLIYILVIFLVLLFAENIHPKTANWVPFRESSFD